MLYVWGAVIYKTTLAHACTCMPCTRFGQLLHHKLCTASWQYSMCQRLTTAACCLCACEYVCIVLRSQCRTVACKTEGGNLDVVNVSILHARLLLALLPAGVQVMGRGPLSTELHSSFHHMHLDSSSARRLVRMEKMMIVHPDMDFHRFSACAWSLIHRCVLRTGAALYTLDRCAEHAGTMPRRFIDHTGWAGVKQGTKQRDLYRLQTDELDGGL